MWIENEQNLVDGNVHYHVQSQVTCWKEGMRRVAQSQQIIHRQDTAILIK